MIVLGIDPSATRTGLALVNEACDLIWHASIEMAKPKKGADSLARLSHDRLSSFYTELSDGCNCSCDFIAIEYASFQASRYAAQIAGTILGFASAIATEIGVELIPIHVQTIKKVRNSKYLLTATAEKQRSIVAAKEATGKLLSHDEADAYWTAVAAIEIGAK